MDSSTPDLTSRLLRRDRALVGGAIAALAVLCWWYLFASAGAAEMADMAAMEAPPYAATVAMWWLMMGAMMLPSAAPTVLLYAQIQRHRSGDGGLPPPWSFLLGYMLVWLGFSIAAAALQRLITGPAMRVDDMRIVAAILAVAGAYQLSPLKNVCLSRCRSPAEFISRHWRKGSGGALRLGVLHGAYCVGCCWLLMAILFAGGVMNLGLVAVLTALVSAEKLLPGGQWVARASGIVLLGLGVAVFARAA